VQRFVADGAVRAALAEGGRIENVVVVAMRDAHGRAEFVPYLSTSWRRGYVAIGLWGGMGARSWRDLTRLVGFLREDFIYPGPISVHEADDPKLRKFRTLVSYASPPPAPSPSTAPPAPSEPCTELDNTPQDPTAN
jgi:hypothetical protein